MKYFTEQRLQYEVQIEIQLWRTKLTSVSFQALADTRLSSELYSDANELLSKVKNDRSVSAGVVVGVGPAGSPETTVDVGLSGSRDSSFVNKLNKYNNKVLKHNACAKQYSIIYTEHVLP